MNNRDVPGSIGTSRFTGTDRINGSDSEEDSSDKSESETHVEYGIRVKFVKEEKRLCLCEKTNV